MVEQNYLLYVNDKKQLRQSKITLKKIGENVNFKFTIPEKHLICGLILNGKPLKGDFLQGFHFSPIEKYLFEFTNVFFIIPDLEYQNENINYNINVNAELLPYPLYFPLKVKDYSNVNVRMIRREGSPLMLSTLVNIKDFEEWFFHPSFDGINFEQYKISDYLYDGYLSYAPYEQFIKDMVGENWNDFYNEIPRYIYFSDGKTTKTNVFYFDIVEES